MLLITSYNTWMGLALSSPS